MTSTHADNITSPLTEVFGSAGNHEWPNAANSWNRIGLQKPFLFVPARGNLLVEITSPTVSFTGELRQFHVGEQFPWFMYGSLTLSVGSLQGYAPKLELCIDRADLSYFGTGCPGTGGDIPALGLTGSSHIGGTAMIVLSNAPPNTSALLSLGSTSTMPYPLDPMPFSSHAARLDPSAARA